MDKYEIGDLVICIDDSRVVYEEDDYEEPDEWGSGLTLGRIYSVGKVDRGGEWFQVWNADENGMVDYETSRFKLLDRFSEMDNYYLINCFKYYDFDYFAEESVRTEILRRMGGLE